MWIKIWEVSRFLFVSCQIYYKMTKISQIYEIINTRLVQKSSKFTIFYKDSFFSFL
jgi:hypothetical protein